MRILNDHILSFRPLAFALGLVFFVLTSVQAQTPEKDRVWTTVGSAGTVDVADIGKVFFENGKVQMGRIIVVQGGAKPRRIIGQQIRSAVIRYNVTAVDGLLTTRAHCDQGECVGPQLTLRFAAEGPRAKVVAKLIEVDLATGAELTRLTIDSAGSPTASGYQTDSIQPDCRAQWRFDFQKKAYYVEATLTARANSLTTIGSVAGIHVIKIGFDSCI